MQYKKAQRPLRDIARELGVEGILEGSVGRSGGRVHVNIQLIYAPSDTHIWAESYDRDLQDVGSLQTELAQTITRQVGLRVSTPAIPPRRISPEAHDAYLMGRYYWFGDNYKKSREFFQKAIGLQPDYAAAWSGLADSYMANGLMSGRARRDAVAVPGEEAARKAVVLDDSLAEAHNTMAAYYYFYRWDWERAEHESARTLELNPGLAEGHHLRGYILQTLNRTDEALQEEKKAMELDPLARPCALTMALIHARRFDAAVHEGRLRAEARPDNSSTHEFLSDAYWYMGMDKEAAQEMETAFQVGGEKESAIGVHNAYARGGFKAVLEWQLDDLKKNTSKNSTSPIALASVYAALRRRDETLHWLEQAYQGREPWLAHIQYLPYLDFVHSEPRYKAIVKKMGLSSAWDESSKAGDSAAR
jgi:tetratricopeptide (TPR) repeat protein